MSCANCEHLVLISSMNPCPCGFYGDPLKPYTCSHSNVTKYQKRISGPLLDRNDILLTAYSPLDRGYLREDYTVQEIARANNATEQVIGIMKVRSRTVRGYKTHSGLLAGLMTAGSGIC